MVKELLENLYDIKVEKEYNDEVVREIVVVVVMLVVCFLEKGSYCNLVRVV